MSTDGRMNDGIRRLGASAVSGLIARCFAHPMDTVRTNVMANPGQGSVVTVLQSVVRSSGVTGLYRGFGITAAMHAPAIASFLTTYDVAKTQFCKLTNLTAQSPLVHLASGLAAETVSAVFWVPMEVLKQRAQLREGASASSIAAFRDLLRHEGLRSLFRGYALTVGTFGPYSMLYFAAYEQWKAFFCRKRGVSSARELGSIDILASASASGGFAAATTTPLDIIKTRIQTQGDVKFQRSKQYKSTWEAFKRIAREEGFRGLTRGMAARVLWIVPQTAITMATFEKLKKVLDIPEIS
ncbi:hypothetical protein NDN08_004261 [Rhodosorus marinus]|uniref:Mitochondrial carrier protein n=1 Tax=Rhodosorus marinus TaxID=101924 RepID=A0AAV8UKS4_9RHOD|nr:hypothetical protein NDN08_004261 [Rhodosorus marinus]